MKTVSFQRLAETAAQIQQNFEEYFKDSKAKTYLVTYPYYIGYFSHERRLTERDLVIAAALVYSWMPTILTLDSYYFGPAVDCLNRAREITPSDVDQLDLTSLAKALNRSIVGMSKLLHFLNPGVFPIYDTKVYCYINNLEKAAGHQTVNKMARYRAYTQNVHQLIGHERFEQDVFIPLKTSVLRLAGYEIGPVRAVELVMFLGTS